MRRNHPPLRKRPQARRRIVPPAVPERVAAPASVPSPKPREPGKPAATDPAEEAVRRMVEAAYT